MPRPTKFSLERANLIIEGLSQGLTRAAAAALADLDESTLSRWISSKSSFASDCEVAEAKAEARFSKVIFDAATPHAVKERKISQKADGSTETVETTKLEFDWRAAESWLKRRRKKDWSERTELTGADGRDLYDHLSDAQLEQFIAEAEAGETPQIPSAGS